MRFGNRPKSRRFSKRPYGDPAARRGFASTCKIITYRNWLQNIDNAWKQIRVDRGAFSAVFSKLGEKVLFKNATQERGQPLLATGLHVSLNSSVDGK